MSAVDTIHKTLLCDIYQHFDVDSVEYHTFEGCIKAIIPLGVLKSKKTLLDKFDAMETRGYLGVGNYATLKEFAEKSKNKNVLDMINKADEEIKKANNDEIGAEKIQVPHEKPGCSDPVTDKVAVIHRQLLNKIYESLQVESHEYNIFVKSLGLHVPIGTLTSKKTLLDKFDALEARGHLKVGSYETLRKIAQECKNPNVLTMIEKAEEEIKKARDKDLKVMVDNSQKKGKSKDVDSKQHLRGKFKKERDDTLSQSMVGRLHAHMEQVGAFIVEHSIVGTVFRVGSKYVMTAFHVVKPIIDPQNKGPVNPKLLTSDMVYINFNESPIQHDGIKYRLTEILFYVAALDFAILELADYQYNITPFRLCKSMPPLETVSIIGFGHPHDHKKHLDPKCPIVYQGAGVIQSAIDSLVEKRQDYKDALISIGIDANLVDLSYGSFNSDFMLMMHCFMEHGASGAPVLTNDNPNSIEVVGVLTHGLPEFYFQLPERDQATFESSFRFEIATRMDKVYYAVMQYDQQLAADLYGTY